MTRREALGAVASGSLFAKPLPRTAIEAMLGRYGVPGASIALIEHAEVSALLGTGVASKAERRAMTGETPFEAASLSKPVVACAALAVFDQRRLNPDTRVGEVLKDDDLPSGRVFRDVTIRQILCHTSGIPPDPPKGRSLNPMFPPGSRFAYSPHAFDYLQRALEGLTGESLPALIERVMFKPAGMAHSAFDWTEKFAAARAIGYESNGQPGQTINERVWRASSERRAAMKAQYPLMNFPNAASSLITTAADYARFLLFAGSPRTFGADLTSRCVSAGPGVEWGLAFGIVESRSHGKGLWQWGDFGIFQHIAAVFPQTGAGLVSLTNGTGGQRFNRDVARMFFSEDLACFRWLRV